MIKIAVVVVVFVVDVDQISDLLRLNESSIVAVTMKVNVCTCQVTSDGCVGFVLELTIYPLSFTTSSQDEEIFVSSLIHTDIYPN